ncbi:MAG: hypothetical protein RMI94_06225 [Bryobacterales bacterium]|nr:hypothetical protein [Bryobacteraceae bacterium]MDW8130126.1 hypothetical protein [Bryobacterales bacterium]
MAAERAEGRAAPEAPREVWVRIEPRSAGERARPAVAVQIAERAGRIEVRVRTADPALGESLRREAPALIERLEREGFRATALETGAPVPPFPAGTLRIAPPEAAPTFEEQGSRQGGGSPTDQHGERRQHQDSAQQERHGEGRLFAREVWRWLHR